ncbi:hypothetical protein EDC04DRAFT_2738545 [Pisolithus marmoratus]|nr:hypothetical protein EDC04DRAFT_2738545 [Pisolithus marmoratus]
MLIASWSLRVCHWFNWSRASPQLARIHHKGGMATAWVCSSLCSHATYYTTTLTEIYTAFACIFWVCLSPAPFSSPPLERGGYSSDWTGYIFDSNLISPFASRIMSPDWGLDDWVHTYQHFHALEPPRFSCARRRHGRLYLHTSRRGALYMYFERCTRRM